MNVCGLRGYMYAYALNVHIGTSSAMFTVNCLNTNCSVMCGYVGMDSIAFIHPPKSYKCLPFHFVYIKSEPQFKPRNRSQIKLSVHDTLYLILEFLWMYNTQGLYQLWFSPLDTMEAITGCRSQAPLTSFTTPSAPSWFVYLMILTISPQWNRRMS